MSAEILPCPFCDGMVSEGGIASYRMVCSNCGYSSAGYQTEADAIAAHNTVAAAVRDHAAVVAERDALREQVAQLRAAGEAPYAVVVRCGQLEAQAVTLIAERDALRAQVAQLREAASKMLREGLSGTDALTLAACRPNGKSAAEFASRARAAAARQDEARGALSDALAATAPKEEAS